MNVHPIDEARTRHKIENIHDLPVTPSVLKTVHELCENPNLSMNDIGIFLARDPSLSAKVLRAVNSPIYGFPQRISTVRHALVLLGLNFLKGLLIGLSVADGLEHTIPGLWKHSAGCAVIARIIAQRVRVPESDEVVIAALLHDIGKMILNVCFPSAYKTCLLTANDKKVALREVERDAFTVNHAQAASWTAQRWGFPSILVEQIKFHHQPNLAHTFPVQTAIVHLSDILVRRRSFGFSGDYSSGAAHPTTHNLLKISEKQAEDMLRQAEGQLSELDNFLNEN